MKLHHLLVSAALAAVLPAQIAVKAETLHTMAGPAIQNGVVVVDADGKITAVGAADAVRIPAGTRVVEAKVVVPGLIDTRSVVGLAGYLNQDEDQDQLDRNEPMQPELRALDAYDVREPLVDWIRSFGVTTVQTGHAPGALIPGQLMIAKTRGNRVEEAALRVTSGVCVTLGEGGLDRGRKSPGTRAKATAMLRGLLLEAQAYAKKDDPEPNLRMQAIVDVLEKKVPLVVHAHRSRDILTALRLKEEFGIELILDGAAEAYLVLEQIKEAGVPVLAHAPMIRHRGELENATFELGAKLQAKDIPFGYQSGFEAYVPKTRVVLFEAGFAAAHGLGFENALRALTIDAARILKLDQRIGSLEIGKDGDLACYDGDPFEYTTHCVTTVIDGKVVFEGKQ